MSVVLPDYLQKDVSSQASLFSLVNKLNSEEINIEEVGNLIPGSVMVQDLGTLTNLYMNNNGCEVLRRCKEELNSLGPAYFDLFFPPEEISILKIEVTKFLRLNDPSLTYSFFQRVRPDDKSDYKWYLSNVRLFNPSESEGNLKLINVALEVNNISYASKQINSICEQSSYAQKNYFKYLLLTRREKEVVKLIASGYNSRYISDSLFISLHTVNNHRKNIMHKLNMKGLIELIKFAEAFSII
ncbi:MAG: helix-turn-helix transcriptional regulator [Mucilaginibacter sp.]|nr:helix-turn-helix transcriptional regulator [Mucilaginibacter sp.]